MRNSTRGVWAEVEVGDEFRCRRRGHRVVVESVRSGEAYYRNAKGAVVKIATRRLMTSSRFHFIGNVKSSDAVIVNPA